ncbi:hypothetical protein RUND412_000868 [Rhizina undulata]
MSPLSFLLPALSIVNCVLAATVTYDWNLTWVNRNPDSLYERRVIGINNEWPLPLVEVTVGDRLVVNIFNGLGDQSATIHFHGMFQNGSNYMDGPSMVVQCPVPPGQNITYDFHVNQPGTYWYHSHYKGQYPDGLRGQFLVHNPSDPYKSQYNATIPLSFSDWYHLEMPVLQKQFISVYDPLGAEPIPNSALMNDTQNLEISVEPGLTYFFRMVNIAAFAPMYIWFEGHSMRVVEVDGVYTEPMETDMIYLAPAQRAGVLVTMLNDTSANWPIVASMDEDLFDKVPSSLNPNVTGWLVYNSTASLPDPTPVPTFDDALDDVLLVSQDGLATFEDPDYSIVLSFDFTDLDNGVNYAFINDVTYVSPKVPTLYTALSAGALATDPTVYGGYTNSFVLGHNQIIEIVLNNLDTGKHPFHLHGHNFQVVYRSAANAGVYDASTANYTYPAVPMRRDTILVYPNGHIILRFRSDNPDMSPHPLLFHMSKWHLDSGLVATMVEAPLEMQKNLTVPQQHLDLCTEQGIETEGNAAGNMDFLDLVGQNASPKPLPPGFTAKGIVAMVFSVACAFMGMAVVGWYGLVDFTPDPAVVARTSS